MTVKHLYEWRASTDHSPENLLRAIEDSIAIWVGKRTLVEDGAPNQVYLGNAYCPLCQLLSKPEYIKYGDLMPPNCRRCPIMINAGYDGCQNTPYMKAHQALTHYKHHLDSLSDDARDDCLYHMSKEITHLRKIFKWWKKKFNL